MVESGTHAELLKIPVERHPPRGKQEVGPIKTGFFHSQWDTMMGEAKSERVEAASDAQAKEHPMSKDAEILKLRAQVSGLERQLNLEMLWSKEKARQVASLTSAHHAPSSLNLERAQSDSPYFFNDHDLPSVCEGQGDHAAESKDLSRISSGFNAWLHSSHRRGVFVGPLGVPPPPPLAFGERMYTA